VPNPLPWYAPLIKALRAAAFFVAHTFLAILIIGLVSLLKAALQWLGDPKLFDWMPLSYVFDMMDATALIVFICFGTLEAVRVFRESSDDS
jgi:hypothetical protein